MLRLIMLCLSIVSNSKSRIFFEKNQNCSQRNFASQPHYLSNYRSNTSKESRNNFIDSKFLKSIPFHTKRKDGANTLCIRSSQRNCYSYNDALQNHESKGSLTWWKTKFFDIDAEVLQGDTLAPYLFVPCLDYLLWMTINLIKENGFTIKKI